MKRAQVLPQQPPPSRRTLADRVCALDLADHVRFLGEVADIPLLLAASDLHIHPSREDAFPNSVLEAMAAGLPVVATAVGAVPHILDGTGSRLCPPRTPAALADAVAMLAAAPVMRQLQGTANAQRARARYGVATVAEAYERLYRATSRTG